MTRNPSFIASSGHGIPHGDVDRRVTVSFAAATDDIVAGCVRATENDMNATTSILVLGGVRIGQKRGRLSAAQDLSLSDNFTSSTYWLPICPTSGNWSDWQRAVHGCRSAPPDAGASATSPKCDCLKCGCLTIKVPSVPRLSDAQLVDLRRRAQSPFHQVACNTIYLWSTAMFRSMSMLSHKCSRQRECYNTWRREMALQRCVQTTAQIENGPTVYLSCSSSRELLRSGGRERDRRRWDGSGYQRVRCADT